MKYRYFIPAVVLVILTAGTSCSNSQAAVITPTNAGNGTQTAQPSPAVKTSPSPTAIITTPAAAQSPSSSNYTTSLTLDEALKNGKPTRLELGSPT